MADETLSVNITADTGSFTSGVERASEELDGFKEKCRQTEDSTTGLGDQTDGLGSKFSALTGVVAGVAQEIASRLLSAVMDLGGEMVAASDSAQKFASTLEFAGIDQGTIEDLTASTQKYADQTVYDLADIRNATAQLAANGVDNYAQLAEAAGNLNAVAGGSASTFQSVSQVMTQTAGSGKLMTENWNQLTDAIPGASGALQDAMRDAGAFEGNFREAMENGEISADEFFAAVQQLGMTDVAKEAATSTETIEGAVGNLEASVVGVGASVIDAFKPYITGTITAMSDAVSWLAQNLDVMAPYAVVAAGALGAVAAVNIASSLSSALSKVGGLAGGFKALWGIISANPLVEAIAVFAAVAAALVGLYQTNETFRNAVNTLFEQISAAVMPVLQQLGALFTSIAAAIAPVVSTVLSMLIPAIVSLATMVGEYVANIIATVMPVISSVLGAVQTAMPAIQAAIETALGVIEGVWNTVWPAIQAVLETVFSVISGVVGTVMGAISAVITAVMQAVSGDWEGAWNTISGFLSGIWETMKSTVSGAIDGVIQFFIDLPGNILDALGDFGSLLLDAGGDLIDGLINGIKGAAGAVGDMLLGIVDDAIGGVLSFLGIASPSKLMAEIGGYTMEGFTVGVDRQAVYAMKEVRASFADVVGGAETALSGLSFGGSLSYAAAPASSGDTNTYYITIDGASVGADAELMRALDAYAARTRQRGRMTTRR